MATSIKDFLGDVVSELIGEMFSVKMLKNILTKSIAERTAGVTGAKTGVAITSAENKMPEIKFGGIFDLSDETDYFGLIARMGADSSLNDAAKKISQFVNGDSFQTSGQRRRFRVVVGNLSNIEYSEEVLIDEKEVANQRGGKPTIERKIKQTKKNLGLEFLKSFSQLTETEMLEICKASGIMESIIDNIGEGLSHASKKIDEVAEKIENSEMAQTVMTSLVGRMRRRRDALRNRRYTNDINDIIGIIDI